MCVLEKQNKISVPKTHYAKGKVERGNGVMQKLPLEKFQTAIILCLLCLM